MTAFSAISLQTSCGASRVKGPALHSSDPLAARRLVWGRLRMQAITAFVVALIAGAITPSAAFVPAAIEMTCPLGGQRFLTEGAASYSIYRERPDGRLYTNWISPRPIPECPHNNLLLYRPFDAREIPRLAELVATREYLAMLEGETPYYRAAWLARRVSPDAYDAAQLLVQAVWEAGDGTPRRARYLQELLEMVDALAPAPGDPVWIRLNARAINAQRELGDFAAALRRLHELRRLSSAGQARSPSQPSGTDRSAQEILSYLQVLERLIRRQNASAEPLQAIPLERAVELCALPEPNTSASPATSKTCRGSHIEERIEALRRARRAFEQARRR